MFFYSDNDSGSFTGDLGKINATKCYLNHYDNYLVLNFISQNTKDRAEKQQCMKELTICERKLKWAERHPNFVRENAEAGVFELKKQWEK